MGGLKKAPPRTGSYDSLSDVRITHVVVKTWVTWLNLIIPLLAPYPRLLLVIYHTVLDFFSLRAGIYKDTSRLVSG